jgi:peptidase E
MLGAMNHSGAIVQFGSGKPGEEGSERFERALFEELGLRDPSIAFLPFHELPPGENDWTRFQAIYEPLTAGPIDLLELVPFAPQKDVAGIERRLRAAQIIVLGAGLVEPYMAAIALSGLDRVLASLHRSGTTLFGYSAGTIALGVEFRHYQTGGELLEILEELLATELADTPLEDAVEAFCSVFAWAPAPGLLRRMLVRRREKGPEALAQDPFVTGLQAETYFPGLGRIPDVAVYPHFGEHHQCTLAVLERLALEHPRTLHIGLPNATALCTSFGPAGLRMTARGHHPRHRVTWIGPAGAVKECSDRDEIPAPLVPSYRLRRPQAGIV